MANEASTLGTQRTIRDYLMSSLINEENGENGIGLQITIPGEIDFTSVYDVDLLWSGQEYLISYKTVTTEDALPVIRRLVDVLPITFVTTTAPTIS
jgi:hypothetical protein